MFESVLQSYWAYLLQAPSPSGVNTVAQLLQDSQPNGYVGALAKLADLVWLERKALFELDITIARNRRKIISELHTLIKYAIKQSKGISSQPKNSAIVFGNRPHISLIWQGTSDGSFKNGMAGIGAVLTSPYGFSPVTAVSPVWVDGPVEAEILALKLVLATALSEGVLNLEVGVDASFLIVYLQKGKLRSSFKPPIHQEFLELLRLTQKFNYLKVSKIPRCFNYAADRLAASVTELPYLR